MATIQIRDVPGDVHAELQRQARAAGQSLQAFMRENLVELTRSRVRRATVLDEMREIARAGRRTSVKDVVLDTSVAVRVLLAPDGGDATLWRRLRDGTCHAPHLIDAETGSALRRLTAQGAAQGAIRGTLPKRRCTRSDISSTNVTHTATWPRRRGRCATTSRTTTRSTSPSPPASATRS